jgi:hypothetical protein
MVVVLLLWIRLYVPIPGCYVVVPFHGEDLSYSTSGNLCVCDELVLSVFLLLDAVSYLSLRLLIMSVGVRVGMSVVSAEMQTVQTLR